MTDRSDSMTGGGDGRFFFFTKPDGLRQVSRLHIGLIFFYCAMAENG